MAFKWYICLPLLLLCGQLFSQVKTLQAVKTNQVPKIDGNLDDAAWANVPVASDFIQNFPTYGIPCSQRTEVKIIYDNTAIYIGAYLHDDPALVRKQITARDGEQQSDVDYFSVFFDTYNDHQNGFQFLVTTANVQSDAKLGPNLSGDAGVYGDNTWDAVWDSKVAMKKDGWTVEMRIPYLSLRFAKKDMQSWGLQMLRFIRRNNESSFWNPVDPQANGFVNQFGVYANLKNILPPLRLSFSPYLSTGYRSTPLLNENLNEWLRTGGMDVKYGLNEGFTLDATLVPDYGQVVSDNVVNNLTPYEIKFQENRPFFTEGTELFNKAGLFYSRRIGATPTGYDGVRELVGNNPNLEILKNPAQTQLYNAIKFSGRTQNKLGIGIFNAVTAPTHAIVRNKITGEEIKVETEPLANYNIVVLDQALRGQSYLTFTNTNVMRDGNSRDADVTAVDVALYDKKNIQALRATVRYSKTWGAGPTDGFNTSVRYGKVSGNWQYFLRNDVESENYDPNDLGYLAAANQIAYEGNLSYRIFKPTPNFITYSYTLDTRLQQLYRPYAFDVYTITGTAFWVFKNFWDVTLTSQLIPVDEHNYFELRTAGRYLSYPLNYYFEITGSTDSRKKMFISYDGTFARSPDYNNNFYGVSLGMRYRFSNKVSLDLETDSKLEKNQLGYAFAREPNNDPIVGFRDNKEFTSVLTGNYNFTSRLNLSVRTRHYWNRVNYRGFYDVNAKGRIVPRAFISGQDQNVNIFNLDAFLTWDFRLGSRIIVGYKNWLGDDETVPITGTNDYLHNLGQTFDMRHGNEFTIRFIYFLDYNQFRKKH
jgi:Domain of unknown function (DUF5916)/Carbohydrate family 9 binding domain-like